MYVIKIRSVILTYLGTFITYQIVPDWFCSGNYSTNFVTWICTDKYIKTFAFISGSHDSNSKGKYTS